LLELLDGLRSAHDEGIARVWVVDNGSTDGSREAVKRDYRWVELVESPSNLGYGPAVNLVARATRSEWLLAANADIRLTKTELIDLLQAGSQHPDAGVISPQLIAENGDPQITGFRFPRLRTEIARALGLPVLAEAIRRPLRRSRGSDRRSPAKIAEIEWARGACLFDSKSRPLERRALRRFHLDVGGRHRSLLEDAEGRMAHGAGAVGTRDSRGWCLNLSAGPGWCVQPSHGERDIQVDSAAHGRLRMLACAAVWMVSARVRITAYRLAAVLRPGFQGRLSATVAWEEMLRAGYSRAREQADL
jgi:Glycosyl transferase family 2